MSRAALASGFAVPLLFSLTAVAQEPEAAAAPSVHDELRALRQTVENQSRQIEALTQQISQLNSHYDSPPRATPVNPPSAESAPPPAAGIVAEVPKADPAAGGPKHTVAKGETLTSISKRYNISVTDLQKANGIKDDRKLQIGQVLSIPASGPSSSEPSKPSNEKKENP